MQTSDLILEDHLAPREALFDGLSARLSVRGDSELLGHPQCGRALKFYLLLTETPELLEDLGADAERIFWSRYYWFVVFVRLHRAAEGFDAGVEQQAFKLLEEGEASGHDVRFAETVAEKVA